MIDELKENEVFVFGSNLAGKHEGGAARQAHEQFGAEMGVGEGLTGKCYAFPTLGKNFQKRSDEQLAVSVARFYKTARENPDTTFLLTKVGCGIAGYPEEYMRRVFQRKNRPENIIYPANW